MRIVKQVHPIVFCLKLWKLKANYLNSIPGSPLYSCSGRQRWWYLYPSPFVHPSFRVSHHRDSSYILSEWWYSLYGLEFLIQSRDYSMRIADHKPVRGLGRRNGEGYATLFSDTYLARTSVSEMRPFLSIWFVMEIFLEGIERCFISSHPVMRCLYIRWNYRLSSREWRWCIMAIWGFHNCFVGMLRNSCFLEEWYHFTDDLIRFAELAGKRSSSAAVEWIQFGNHGVAMMKRWRVGSVLRWRLYLLYSIHAFLSNRLIELLECPPHQRMQLNYS